ncbi:hypothetical protein [Brevifollis gellanilyticus]|uniref:Phytase-like domain-containing protein n=1 Tax=Brevifollis gellanilyticus TaxID=748831 RepID=A0A512M1V5_9BACT|nr:hypothetical protein [Brevifollis gellanilyticus]GEP40730.1 hypothetical protein BGE01nite_00210 [Brevifollis gellanilyticus]
MKTPAFLLAACSLALPLSAALLDSPQNGGLSLKSISSISFGKDGLLLVADPASQSVIAIETKDAGPKAAPGKVADLAATIAAGLGTTAENITIKDMAVNPASGKVYLAVQRRPDNASLILVVDSAGKVTPFDASKLSYSSVTLPGGTASKVTNITDVAFDGERVFATGSCNEEFASRIFTIPVPIKNGSTASVISAETYHVAHRKWETKAPIQSFIPYHKGDEDYVVGAFACTPVAKFRVDDIESGAKVKGVSMVELGSGNRPLDLFEYTDKSGKDWVVVHTQRFKDNAFGPSKFWGARVSLDHINASDSEKTNEKATWRDVKAKTGPEGIEIVDALFGAVQVDKLGDQSAVVLRDTDGKLSLEAVELP